MCMWPLLFYLTSSPTVLKSFTAKRYQARRRFWIARLEPRLFLCGSVRSLYNNNPYYFHIVLCCLYYRVPNFVSFFEFALIAFLKKAFVKAIALGRDRPDSDLPHSPSLITLLPFIICVHVAGLFLKQPLSWSCYLHSYFLTMETLHIDGVRVAHHLIAMPPDGLSLPLSCIILYN